MSSIHESMFGLSINEPSPIIKAIEAGQLSKRLLKALLAEGANVNYSSDIYGTPLIAACSHGPLSVVELLLRHGADPNKGRRGGKYGKYDYTTPLAHCCDCKTRFISQNAVQLCRLLIEYGAAIDGDDSELGGRTPLVVASSCGRLDLMRLLLDRGAGVEINAHCRQDELCAVGCGETLLRDSDRLAAYVAAAATGFRRLLQPPSSCAA